MWICEPCNSGEQVYLPTYVKANTNYKYLQVADQPMGLPPICFNCYGEQIDYIESVGE